MRYRAASQTTGNHHSHQKKHPSQPVEREEMGGFFEKTTAEISLYLTMTA
jgi:hypothetical protein